MNAPPQPQNCHQTVTPAWVAFGSNLPGDQGSPREMVTAAAAALQRRAPDLALSPLYKSPAYPAGAGPDFVNAVGRLSWSGTAEDLLAELHAIEAELGRVRQKRWEARVVDLDLLAFGEAIQPDHETANRWHHLSVEEATKNVPTELILPHPRLSERAFVLKPLCDLDPDWRHPLTHLRASELCRALPAEDLQAVTLL